MKLYTVGCLVLASQVPTFAAELLGVTFGNGDLYTISSLDASKKLIGNLGLVGGLGSLETAPDGTVYGFSVDLNGATLFRIDPNTAQATEVGPLNVGQVFEGGLAFAPNGTAYGVNGGNTDGANLFTINLATGQAALVGSMGKRDINGLAWRNDGMLVGLDSLSDSLVQINPGSGATLEISGLTIDVGTTGGMVGNINANGGVFATGGNGTNSLYSFNAFTGEIGLIGPLNLESTGIGGLAYNPVPEPTSLIMIGVGWIALLRRKRAQ